MYRPKINAQKIDNNTVRLNVKCNLCEEPQEIDAPLQAWANWCMGQPIQIAFKCLSADDREVLFGTCPPCFEKLISDLDEL